MPTPLLLLLLLLSLFLNILKSLCQILSSPLLILFLSLHLFHTPSLHLSLSLSLASLQCPSVYTLNIWVPNKANPCTVQSPQCTFTPNMVVLIFYSVHWVHVHRNVLGSPHGARLCVCCEKKQDWQLQMRKNSRTAVRKLAEIDNNYKETACRKLLVKCTPIIFVLIPTLKNTLVVCMTV